MAYPLSRKKLYEYYLSLVFKALLWTVPAKQPQVVFIHLPDDGFHVERGSLPQPISIGFRCSRLGGLRGKMLVTVCDKTNREEFRRETVLSVGGGETTMSFNLPRLKAGGHFLDLIVRSDVGTEEWGSVFFHVDSKFALAEFRTEKGFHEKGEAARVTASLSAPAPPKAKLRVSLTDTVGRLYSLRELPVPAGHGR